NYVVDWSSFFLRLLRSCKATNVPMTHGPLLRARDLAATAAVIGEVNPALRADEADHRTLVGATPDIVLVWISLVVTALARHTDPDTIRAAARWIAIIRAVIDASHALGARQPGEAATADPAGGRTV